MKKIICLLIVFSGITSVIRSQVINKSITPVAGIDYSRLAKIDTLINNYIKNGWEKAMVTIIVKDNKIVQYKGYGYLDTAMKKPIPNDAIFRIMSQTKAITSLAIMMLYEDGKFLLDQPIADFIPKFKKITVLDKFNAADTTYTTVPAKRDITFRDLLTHTSGIDYADIGSNDMRAIYAKAGIPSGLGHTEITLMQFVKLLAKQPLKFQPGTQFQYGLNTDLLGGLVELISGQSLEKFFHTRIFEPLGMNDSYFNVPAAKASRLASVYTEDDKNNIIPWSHTFRNIDPDYPILGSTFFSGGAGLSSTAYDYAIFLQMLLNKGKYNGKQLLAPRTVELMLSGQLDFVFSSTNNFGLGFEITSDKATSRSSRNKGSFAWGGYFGTTYWADPKANMVCLIMTQHNPNSHGDLAAKVETLIYSSLK